ncbi:MAG: class B sortase [Eubacterium sp.]|nr:class B sortase [Eubacterium sp.]
MKKKKRYKKKNRFASFFFTLAIIACVGIIGFSGYKLISIWMQYKAGDDEYASLREFTAPSEASVEEIIPEVTPEPAVEEIPEVTEEEKEEEEVKEAKPEADPDYIYTRRKPPIDVDWDSLKEINEDIVGWIYIGVLDLSYPVVHGEDDDYYLHRTFMREDNFAGSIFVEADNHGDFKDPNTIIYGHNMLNGSMFGSLSRLTSEELYKEDPYFWIMTPKGNIRYRMFSIHETAVDSNVYTLFNGVDHKFLAWCKDMKKQSKVELQDEKFSLHSRVVTLSTCTGDVRSRYVVQGIAVQN